MSWLNVYWLVFVIGVAAAAVATPLCRRLALRVGLMDRPKEEAHKQHGHATPLLGGLALFGAWALCLIAGYFAVFAGWFDQFSAPLAESQAGVRMVGARMAFIVLGAAGAMLLGLADDRRGMKPAVKFGCQFLIALLAVWAGGVRITLFIDNFFLTAAITIFWYMLLMNAINFFDNMDGLAVGTATIALAFFALTAAWQQQYFIATLSALSCGVGCGFWLYNASPASIFMGDSGSLFLGYLLATISASVTYYSSETSSFLAVLLPLFILALPLFDAGAVVLIRLRKRKPFWIGDHNHISHRFVAMGMSRAQAVNAVHLLAIIIALSVWPLLWADRATAAVLFTQALLLLGLVTLLQYSTKRP